MLLIGKNRPSSGGIGFIRAGLFMDIILCHAFCFVSVTGAGQWLFLVQNNVMYCVRFDHTHTHTHTHTHNI